MFASLLRILVLIGLGTGAYFLYPRIKPELEQIKTNPRVLGESVIAPVVDNLNSVLPDHLQIKAFLATSSANLINQSDVVQNIKTKAGELANDQIEVLKQEAGKQFCSVLIEKIKTECSPTP